jgi:hypothetical protein
VPRLQRQSTAILVVLRGTMLASPAMPTPRSNDDISQSTVQIWLDASLFFFFGRRFSPCVLLVRERCRATVGSGGTATAAGGGIDAVAASPRTPCSISLTVTSFGKGLAQRLSGAVSDSGMGALDPR